MSDNLLHVTLKNIIYQWPVREYRKSGIMGKKYYIHACSKEKIFINRQLEKESCQNAYLSKTLFSY